MKYSLVHLGDVCTFTYGDGLKESDRKGGSVPVYGSNGIVGYHDTPLTSGETIIIGRKGSIGEIHISRIPCWPIDTTYYIDRTKLPCDFTYLFYILFFLDLTRFNKSAAIPGLNREDAYEQMIPFHPIPDQQRIAAILQKADRIRQLRRYARQLSDGYLQSVFLEMFGDPVGNSKGWKMKPIKELGRVVTGSTPPTVLQGMFGGFIPFITPGDLTVNTLSPNRYLTERGAKRSETVRGGSTLVCCIGATIGKIDKAIVTSAFNQQINAIEWSNVINDDFGLHALSFFSQMIAKNGSSTTLPILKKSEFEKIEIPVPPIEEQNDFCLISDQYARQRNLMHESERQAEQLFQSLLHQVFEME